MVTDASGGAIANASVEIKNTGTGLSRTVVSDSAGRYTINNLPIGDYDATASLSGFQTVVRKGISLTVGAQIVVDFALPVGQQQQTVTVDAQVSQVETTSSSVSSLVDQRQIRELPLNGRNIEQLILLAPGVQQFTTMSQNSFFGRNATYSVAGGNPDPNAPVRFGQQAADEMLFPTFGMIVDGSLDLSKVKIIQPAPNAGKDYTLETSIRH